MKVLITGAKGQLGQSLQATAPQGANLVCLGSADLDISLAQAVTDAVSVHRPDVIINAAAYTAVDRAEQDQERAFAINGRAPGFLADAARQHNARFVHVSTDFVFDGSAGIPYAPDAPTSPTSVYGHSKRAGELAAGEDALIVRTAWVYAPTGGNFVRTMLRLMGERSEVRVVADQVGTPTYAPALANAIWTLVAGNARGMHHYTDSGVASWYDFAVAIQEEALDAGLLAQRATVVPIPTAQFPTPARRPHYSVLDKDKTYAALGAPAPHWRVHLREMIRGIKENG